MLKKNVRGGVNAPRNRAQHSVWAFWCQATHSRNKPLIYLLFRRSRNNAAIRLTHQAKPPQIVPQLLRGFEMERGHPDSLRARDVMTAIVDEEAVACRKVVPG